LFQYNIAHIGNIEEIITYLLVNSGYLTTQRINGSYHFSIPNHEVRIEFQSVLSKELREITTGIQAWSGESEMLIQFLDVFNSESDMIKIALAISEKDQATLEAMLSNMISLKCNAKDYNFNLLHLGAISGDVTVFNTLLNFCGKDSLQARDKGLNALDYAHLSKNKDIIEAIKILDPELEESVKAPDDLASIVCYKVFGITAGPISLIVATATTTAKLIVDKIMPGYGKVAAGIVTAFLSICTKDISKAVEKNTCTDYNNYHGINENSLHSLKEFEKYSMIKSSNYVTLQGCNTDDLKLSTLKMPILSKSHLENKYLNFTLCTHKCDSENIAGTESCILSEHTEDSHLIGDIIIGGMGGAYILGLLGLTGYAAWQQIEVTP
jgi:hypothetical protein